MALTHTLPLHKNTHTLTQIRHGFILALLFCIPLSSSLKSITLMGAILLITLAFHRSFINILSKQPWVFAILGFMLVITLGCLWSPATGAERFFVIEKYSKLLWLPILALGFQEANIRYLGLHIFLSAMVITAFLAIGVHWDLCHIGDAPGEIFHNYITTGHMMSFAAYLAGYFAKKTPSWRWAYLSLWAMFSYEVLFLSQGRTGYIIYFVLMLLLIIQVFKQKNLWLGLCLIASAGILANHYSPQMQVGFHQIKVDLQGFQHGGKDTSVGYRLQFHQFALSLFKENPFLGAGTGGLTHYFDERHPIPAWEGHLTEPHSQYWLVAAETGLLGLLAYAICLTTLLFASLRLTEMKPFAIALWLPFLIGSGSDSLLFHSGSGYFFLTFLALCLGEGISSSQPKR